MEQVRREQSRLRAFVRALGVRAEAVDDIAQDALLIAYERLAVFRAEEDFGAWVRGIARRLVANWLRKENRRRSCCTFTIDRRLLPGWWSVAALLRVSLKG